MKKILVFFLFILISVLTGAIAYSQYTTHGSASQLSCNCYSLTPDSPFQSGTVWRNTKINLTNSFDFSFKVFLGCDDNGADGIVFILGRDTSIAGVLGGGLGFQGIIPSVGVSLDTYQNLGNDPPFDHISIQANGNIIDTSDLAGPLPASTVRNNIKDCNWHILRIKWDIATHTLSTYFDGVFRLSTHTDLITTIFNNNPLVYWGFSGSTGAHYNLQQFCTILTTDLIANSGKDSVCFGNPIIFKDQSKSYSTIQNYYWDFGDGVTSTESEPTHNYAQPGIYSITHSITTEDGCSNQIIKKIIVGDKPAVSFNIYDTCKTFIPRLENTTKINTGSISQWNWLLDGSNVSNIRLPVFNNLSAGSHSVSLIALSNYGCISDTVTKIFEIKSKPDIDIKANNSCVNISFQFTPQQKDSLTTINSWYWNFGDGHSSNLENINHSFTKKGVYTVQLTASAINGCSQSALKNIMISEANAFAGNDTLVEANTNFALHGSGGDSYNWSPNTGLNNPEISNPVGYATDNITYLLTIKTDKGCTDTSSIKVSVFKGSAIYVPTGFTPNNDGRNDILKPAYFSIKSVSYFTIYDRWGHIVFSTSDMNSGWNGLFKGQNSETGSFVWILKATDFFGKIYNLKGSFTLLR